MVVMMTAMIEVIKAIEKPTSKRPLGCVGGVHSINTDSLLSARARTFSGGPEGAGTATAHHVTSDVTHHGRVSRTATLGGEKST